MESSTSTSGATTKKIKPFSFYVDGYFSVAEEIVSIYKNSRGFTLTEYEGRDEFYHKYFDYYAVLLDQVTLCDASISKADAQCLNDMSEFLEQQMDQNTATLTMFFHAYKALMWHIDQCNGKKGNRYQQLICNVGGFAKIEKEIFSDRSNPKIVPMITTRGVYGFNTFLYMYFNGLFPVGITTNPIIVHGVEVGDSASNNIRHDLDHYDNVKWRNSMSEYPAYKHILQNQKEIGSDKCKGLLFILFFIIHENRGEGVDESLRIMNLYWYDWWKFMIVNTHYTPESFGIVFPKMFRHFPINITDNYSEGFKIAMVNDSDFHNDVRNFYRRFVIATHKDYKRLKRDLA